MKRMKSACFFHFLLALCVIGITSVMVHRHHQKLARDRALLQAIMNCHDTIAIRLIRQGADPNSRMDPDNKPSFWEQWRSIFHLVPAKPSSGPSALNLALDRGKIRGDETVIRAPNSLPLIQTMVEHGAEVNAQEPGEEPPLNLAAEFHSAEVTRLLIEYGAVVNCRDAEGQTPLMRAAGWSTAEAVRLLLDHGATVDAVDRTGETALVNACLYGENASVRLLVEHHARVDVVDETKRAPLSCLAGRVNSVANVRLLMDHGATVNSCEMDGLTPLMRAAGWGDAEAVRLLLDHGANVGALDQNGKSALNWACEFGNDTSVHLLLERHAHVNIADKWDNTPLSRATEGAQEGMSIKDEDGTRKYRHIVRMLSAAGAKN